MRYLAMMTVIFSVALGQACAADKASWGAAGVKLGWIKLDSGELNSVLNKYDYPGLPAKLPLVGVGGFACMGGQNLYSAGYYGCSASYGSALRRLDAGLRSADLTALFGGRISGEEGFIGFYITLSAFSFKLDFTKRNGKSPSAGEIMDDPASQAQSGIRGGSYSIGLGLSTFLRAGSIIMGLNYGRQYFPEFTWHSDSGEELPELPKYKKATYGIINVFYGNPPPG
jgi:hypothetical protein